MSKLNVKKMSDNDSPTTRSSSPANPELESLPNSINTIHIGGLPVKFPYQQPYGTQLAFMNRVISTLDRSQKEGRCHALLESPTGTGKSLSLLCSALAWQQNQKLKNCQANLTHSNSRPDPEAVTDPINHGGGFIPETQSSGNPGIPPPMTANSKKEKPRLAPTIIYASRTHSQISQVIREYKKTCYRVAMAVLGSRKHYCTNPYLRGEGNVDEQCKLLLKNREVACPEFKNVHKVKGHPSLQKGGCHEVHDIEDLVKIGQVVKGCSYFAARSMAQDAELVFCPYNYVINPMIREAMEVDIKGCILIFDEAHNIEDVARDAGSFDIEEEVLLHLQTELGQLCINDAMTYQPLLEMTQDIICWIDRRKNTLVKQEFQRYFHCWTGDKALKELHEASISLHSFSILSECAKKAIKAASEAEPDVVHLSGIAATTLERLFSSLSYFFCENGIHAHDYELALQRCMKKGESDWTNTFSLWCLNPAVVFKRIADSSQSMILTSGTLSPLNTFSSELGVQFGTCLEAPHIIDVDSQVWAAAIAMGPGPYPLNASYKTADEYAFQDELGTSLEAICEVVPGGCLVFFPSYKLLDKLSTRWQETGQWSRLHAKKSLFVEPRGGSQDTLEPILKDYYDTIRRCANHIKGRKTNGKKLGLKRGSAKPKDIEKEGAAFLAVCRGKVSEGMDFADDNARTVVIVGIPFPNMYDIKVAQKKKFNDTYELSKKLLNGNDWYCHQAFRALNQAIGRCIRHRFDYGAIIFLDERFHKDRNRANISKWLRKSIKLYTKFDESIDSLKFFFTNVKDCIGVSVISSQNHVIGSESIKSVDVKRGIMKKDHKLIKPSSYQPVKSNDHLEDEEAAGLSRSSVRKTKCGSLHTQTTSEVVLIIDEKDTGVHQEYNDLECVSANDLRWTGTPLVTSSDDLKLTFVQETPDVNAQILEKPPEFFFKDECSSPRADYKSTSLHEPSSSPPTSFHYSQPGSVKTMCSALVTPESVNSHVWKRRKLSGLSSGRIQEFENPAIPIPDGFSSLASLVTTEDANYRNERSCLENKFCSDKSLISSTLNNAGGSHIPCAKLQIFCSSCKSSLGIPENNLDATCSLVSLSKVHLISLREKSCEAVPSNRLSVDVLVCDTSAVHKCLLETTREGASGQGIWCKEDGCVFDSIFCPFCIDSLFCLGVHVVATDASNATFQNKILFYRDRLEIKKSEELEATVSSPQQESMKVKSRIAIEKFAFNSPTQFSGGWRNTKSRMRLPKKS